MKHYSLRTILSVQFAIVILSIVFLISISANILVNRQYEKYLENQQKNQAETIALSIAEQYHSKNKITDNDYMHGIAMYAMEEGYFVKVKDTDGNTIWDAMNHDMEKCSIIMQMVSNRMEQIRPEIKGEFITYSKNITGSGGVLGTIDISYYGPYYLKDNDFQFIETINKIAFIIGVASILGVSCFGMLLANRLTRPIAKTVEITEQIAEGDYTIRFRDGVKTKELFDLSRAVNHMAETLEQQENLRKSLTSDVAHELRTPLSNISSYLEAILEGVWEPTPARLKSCYDEVNRLSEMVSDLEKLRQIESENLKLTKTYGDITELIKIVCSQFEKQMADKQILYSLTGESVFMQFDYSRMQQVWINLISNAVKYSETGGKIRITVEKQENQVKICISDEGVGIAEAEQKLIFERFYRTDKSRNRKTGGAGIGLTIVKAIVQAHHGKILVDSKKGQGTTFTVILPDEK